MGLLDELKKYVRDALPGGLLNPEWTPERTRMAGSTLLDFTPVVGDVKSAYEGVQAAREGDYIGAGLGALGVLPFVPSMVGMVKGGKAIDALKSIPEPPRAEAMRIAQQNAAKPVSEGGLGLRPDNTPMERAEAMGFDDGWYHGSPNEVKGGLKKTGERTNSTSAKMAVWASDSPDLASDYAGYRNWNGQHYAEEGANVIPLMIAKKNPGQLFFSRDARGGGYFDAVGEFDSVTDMLKDAKKRQYKGIQISNLEDQFSDPRFSSIDPATHIAAFNPSSFRSRFAAFDPARRHEADLLGQVTPEFLPYVMGAGLLGAYGMKSE